MMLQVQARSLGRGVPASNLNVKLLALNHVSHWHTLSSFARCTAQAATNTSLSSSMSITAKIQSRLRRLRLRIPKSRILCSRDQSESPTAVAYYPHPDSPKCVTGISVALTYTGSTYTTWPPGTPHTKEINVT